MSNTQHRPQTDAKGSSQPEDVRLSFEITALDGLLITMPLVFTMVTLAAYGTLPSAQGLLIGGVSLLVGIAGAYDTDTDMT